MAPRDITKAKGSKNDKSHTPCSDIQKVIKAVLEYNPGNNT